MYLNSSKAKDKLYKDIIIDRIKNIESNKKQLEREISSISFKISNLYNKRLSEEIDEKNYKEQYQELSNYRKKLQCEINNIEENFGEERNKLDSLSHRNEILNKLEKIEQKNFNNISIRELIDKIEIYKNDIDIQFKFSKLEQT